METVYKTHLVIDMWRKYVLQLLSANPDWTTGRNGSATTYCRKDYYVYRPYDKFDNKLKHKKVEVINFSQFRDVVETYFTRAKAAMIEGETVNMMNYIGKLFVVRVERNLEKKRVDFYNTLKYPKVLNEKGEFRREHVVYFTSEDWCRVHWQKTRKLTNEFYYCFKPTKNLRSKKGFAEQLSVALASDTDLRYRYIYFPRKIKSNGI